MKNLRFEVVSETGATISWETDTERCHIWFFSPDSQGTVIHVDPLQRADGTFPGRGDKDYFPHRTRDLHAKANLPVWKRIKALIARTDIPAEFDRYERQEKAKQVEKMRQARIEALKRAVELIGEAQGDDLAAALVEMPVEVARFATRLNTEWGS